MWWFNVCAGYRSRVDMQRRQCLSINFYVKTEICRAHVTVHRSIAAAQIKKSCSAASNRNDQMNNQYWWRFHYVISVKSLLLRVRPKPPSSWSALRHLLLQQPHLHGTNTSSLHPVCVRCWVALAGRFAPLRVERTSTTMFSPLI